MIKETGANPSRRPELEVEINDVPIPTREPKNVYGIRINLSFFSI